MRFSKIHGLGNDFVVLDVRKEAERDYAAAARKICAAHTGVGANGLLLVCDSDRADIRMRIINEDGSEAEMCGNGIRCFAKYVYEAGIVQKDRFTIETLGGMICPQLTVENGLVTGICVDMGEPRFERKDIPAAGDGFLLNEPVTADGKDFLVSAVNTGVPHAVVFTDTLEEEFLCRYGRALEVHPLFPKHTNVNFVRPLDDRTLEVRTWERGCGRTLACGTGSCAVGVIAAALQQTGREAEIRLALGSLFIRWDEETNHIFMTGPAETVFTGELSPALWD